MSATLEAWYNNHHGNARLPFQPGECTFLLYNCAEDDDHGFQYYSLGGKDSEAGDGEESLNSLQQSGDETAHFDWSVCPHLLHRHSYGAFGTANG